MAKGSRGVDRFDHARCKDCRVSRYEGVKLSARGLCIECAARRVAENDTEISTHSGPRFEHYARRTIEGLTRALENAS